MRTRREKTKRADKQGGKDVPACAYPVAPSLWARCCVLHDKIKPWQTLLGEAARGIRIVIVFKEKRNEVALHEKP